jgi:hypothetical protein
VSSSLRVHQVGVLNLSISDHLPVAVEVEVPESVCLEKNEKAKVMSREN